jgi:hypothetical protein
MLATPERPRSSSGGIMVGSVPNRGGRGVSFLKPEASATALQARTCGRSKRFFSGILAKTVANGR